MKTYAKRSIGLFIATLISAALFPISAFAFDKGDVNENGSVNIIDAQIAYDIACDRLKTELNYPQMKAASDINEDGTVDAADARAIQYFVHRGTFEEPGPQALTLDSYSVKDGRITAYFSYLNVGATASTPSSDYSFSATQGGYVLSTFSHSFHDPAPPGFRDEYLHTWRLRDDQDVIVKATPQRKGLPALEERISFR